MTKKSFKKNFLLFLIVYLVSSSTYSYLFPAGTFVDDALRKSETLLTVGVLNLFFERTTSHSTLKDDNSPRESIKINGKPVIGIVNECNAFKIHLIFSLFIVFIAGNYSKWLALGLGNLIIYGFNVIRLVILTIIAHFSREQFDFHHEYTFSLLLYLIVFVMWYFYLNEKQKTVE